MIPVFATLYGRLPSRSFYDANITRESAFSTAAAHLRTTLATALRVEATATPFTASGRRIRVDPQSITVGEIDVPPGNSLTMQINGRYDSARGGHLPAGGWIENIEVDTTTRYSFRVIVDGFPADWSYGYVVRAIPFPTLSIVSEAGGPPLQVLFPAGAAERAVPVNVSADQEIMLLSSGAANELDHYFQIGQGDPSAAPGEWLRMLYFSASTATTLGFGDITPLTTTARTLTTIEAVVEVVAVGLFLNALAWGVRRRRA